MIIKKIVWFLGNNICNLSYDLKEDLFSANVELWTNLVVLQVFVSSLRLGRAAVKSMFLRILKHLLSGFSYRLEMGLTKLSGMHRTRLGEDGVIAETMESGR